MKSFTYTIVDPVGIHARPAGLLVKTAKAFSGTEISVTKGDKTVKSTQLMKLMGLGVMASISEAVDFDTAALVAEELGMEMDKDTAKRMMNLVKEMAIREKRCITREEFVALTKKL